MQLRHYLILFMWILLVSIKSEAAPRCEPWVARVTSVQGKVDARFKGSEEWQTVQSDDTLCPGDKIRTSKWARSTLRLHNDSVLSLDQNTTLNLEGQNLDKLSWLLKLFNGSVFFRSRESQKLNVETPFINAVHEGTEFLVKVTSENTEIAVFDGVVAGQNSQGRIQIKKGFLGVAGKNQAPTVQALRITPEDAVQWALYYPPLVAVSPDTLSRSSVLQSAYTDYQHGDSTNALTKLNEIPLKDQDAQFLSIKAGLLLSVGRVDEASRVIQMLEQSNADPGRAKAFKAVIAVSKNQQKIALEFANQAVTLDPKSSLARIAQSYAYQALFNIDEALNAAEAATRLSATDPLAWARLSELQLSRGDHDAALISAQKARTLNPNMARTQVILGFADLAQTEIDAAKQAFEQAIVLDSSDPLARLGLGLVNIRKGDLDAGKSELETAVNLDPNNAVMRSYLGKAYYELRNKDYSGTEYKIAKEMDPKDPTPWFYDAILKQTINRPIEALHDMQQAIKLNDNRGVYRSRLLLDSDSAARSASLGRIYNDLGFQQRGLLEGWNSINNDPGNYSAHRLLADNYAVLPRHEIARLSELLKAQLLQPVNITPVQPQAAESNLLILDGLGSSITSFNEYNPLFTRNRLALQTSGFYGSNNTLSDEVVHSGVWDRFSYSLGQFHYQTDGFRENNQQKKDLYNFFAQTEITKNTNAQIELRRSEQEFGDINQGFFTRKFSPLTHGRSDNNIIRAGLHHAFTENSDLLMSIVHSEGKSTGLEDSQGNQVAYSRKIDGTQYELQQIYRHNNFDLTFGMNYLINQSGALNTLSDSEGLNFSFNHDSEHQAFYLYSNIKALPELLITVGFSQDFYQQKNTTSSPLFDQTQIAELERNPLNPKFGLTWTPTKDTTFRFAAFRSLKRGIIQKQTLEPTQIAGFNQFFDDMNGSIARRIGFGLDHRFTARLLVGAEVSRRYLDIPFESADAFDNSNFFDKTRWNEKNARAYVNWMPNERLSLGMDYSYEKLNRNKNMYDSSNNNSNFFTQLETHRTQLFGNFYHPSGFISKLNLAYVNQSGNFFNTDVGGISPSTSNFFLLGVEMGFRFPKRHGLITVGVKNLLDNRFNFQGTDVNYPELPQARFFFSRLTLSF